MVILPHHGVANADLETRRQEAVDRDFRSVAVEDFPGRAAVGVRCRSGSRRGGHGFTRGDPGFELLRRFEVDLCLGRHLDAGPVDRDDSGHERVNNAHERVLT